MNAFFYPRLALSGMRRDRRIYAPYLAACVFMTAVVYDLAFLADSPVPMPFTPLPTAKTAWAPRRSAS